MFWCLVVGALHTTHIAAALFLILKTEARVN
jgi:hypothetical protein